VSAAVSELTVGIDIGTSSVKAVAVDADGNIAARSRIPHDFFVPTPLRFEHDAKAAWHEGPRRALDALGDVDARGVSVAAMVPSLTSVDADGIPCAPGLLYGDERGHADRPGAIAEAGELAQFLHWQAHEYPDARGYWMAQGVANHALSGRPVISSTVAATAFPLFDWTQWDEKKLAEAGARPEQMPIIGPSGHALGEVEGRPGCVLEGGTIDAMGEQLVAGCDDDGDVLVICGTTLIVWAVTPDPVDIAHHYSIPHTAPGKFLLGGPSNAGGLFLNWVDRMCAPVADGAGDGTPSSVGDPGRVPIWAPYPRGERVPFQDPEPAGRVRGGRLRDASDDRRVSHSGAAHRRDGRWHKGRGVDAGARRLHGPSGARVRGARGRRARCRVPRPGRGRPRDVDERRGALGAHVARGRSRSGVGERRRRPVRAFLRGCRMRGHEIRDKMRARF
jgi:xylulokinase